ncbi:histone deacetylase hda1-like protein [Dothistroma septosporum NZE10]|uniref:Histone deacetylase n=1 Tax=Dothistroma septosporum (strain NZE10 / CBS 128990) TaxID=675120 RepID=N1PY53_DOTSN|nr:histone deacetylase hda1-like protein [Dothistroma septosporum NZE10]
MEEESEDVLMHDADVLESTERRPMLTDSTGTDILIKTDLSHPDATTTSSPKALPITTSTLKGSGLRRENGSTDQQLTAKKDGPKLAKFKNLPYATSQTGLVYDVRMRFHVEAEPVEDDMHPEDPRRIHAIYEAFVNAGLAWREGQSGPSSDYYMGRIDARMVTREEVCRVHTVEHFNWVQSLRTLTTDELKEERQYPDHQNDSIYLSTSTPYCAALSAGGAIEACRAVVLGKVKNVFAVIRPPGHHAEREDAKGFCFYDNCSIATKACQAEFGEKCRKVFILDWDVHHGNGIQEANYDDPNVLYISLHMHKKGSFYPEHSYRDNRVAYGDHLHCGSGAGLGKNVNIPWSKQGMGDADYIYAFQQIVMPIAIDFDPDLVVIAAGFDAAEGDMLGGCKVSPAGYAHMTHMLMSLADGKMAVCLEGGYNLESISRSATAVARTMMGEPPDRLAETTPSISAVDDVKLVLRQQSRFWSCLFPKNPSERLAGSLHGIRMHNIVREWQAEIMFTEHRMFPLSIQRQELAREYENQVLATSNYLEPRPLLLILHDPPEVLASPDPRTGRVELHNTWLTDIVKTYVDWAVRQGFAVIDVNLPRHIAEYDKDNREHKETDSIESRTREATQVLTYLWENHVELNEATHVFLMGTNIGHGAILNFIKAHEDQAQNLMTKVISFVQDVSLISCKSPTNDLLPGWYYSTSMVFVANDHSYWATEYARKPKKRFGRVSRSEESSISDMLLEHRDEIFRTLLSETAEWRAQKPEESEDGRDVNDAAPARSPSPKKMPPFGNVILSPAPKSLAASGLTSVTSNGGSSPSRLPPVGNFTMSSPKR